MWEQGRDLSSMSSFGEFRAHVKCPFLVSTSLKKLLWKIGDLIGKKNADFQAGKVSGGLIKRPLFY